MSNNNFKKTILELNMSRFDNYIEKADSKASINLTLSLGISSVIIAVTYFILQTYDSTCINIFLVVSFLIFLSLVVSIFYTLKVLTPRTPKSRNNYSLFYFEDVSKNISFENITEDSYLNDLEGQVKVLANITSTKMKFVRFSTYFLIVALALSCLLILLIYIIVF